MLGILGRPRKGEPPEDADTVSILGVRRHAKSVKLTVRFEGKTWKELSRFAREKGHVRREEFLSLLFSYGVSDREGIDIGKRRSEMFALGGSYSTVRFQAYELFTDNRALTLALSSTLSDNRRLRRLAEEQGLAPPKKEEWDDWSRATIDGFYQRYLFVR